MAGVNIPERLINFRVYGGVAGLELVGLADVELPSFDAMTESVSGAGIAGEYDSPVLGHFGSQTLKLNWRVLMSKALALLAPIQHILDVRGSIQTQNPLLGTLITQAVRVQVRGQCKNFGLGKMEPGKVMESTTEIECASIRISLGGLPIVDFDKFNMVLRINGVDYMQQARIDMGGV